MTETQYLRATQCDAYRPQIPMLYQSRINWRAVAAVILVLCLLEVTL